MTEPRFRLTEAFMAKCYAAKRGCDEAEAMEAVVALVSIELAFLDLFPRIMESRERDSRMLELVGQGIPRVTVAMRMSVSRKTLHQNLKGLMDARRSALRAAS